MDVVDVRKRDRHTRERGLKELSSDLLQLSRSFADKEEEDRARVRLNSKLWRGTLSGWNNEKMDCESTGSSDGGEASRGARPRIVQTGPWS